MLKGEKMTQHTFAREEKLLTCPFCGLNGFSVISRNNMHQILCGGCGAQTKPCKSEKEAAGLWNKRVNGAD